MNTEQMDSPKYFCVGCNKGYRKDTPIDARLCRYFNPRDFKDDGLSWMAFVPVFNEASHSTKFHQVDDSPDTTECICITCAKYLDSLSIPIGTAFNSYNCMFVVTREELLRLKPLFGGE